MRDTKEVARRILTASIITGPFMLIGALPAAAGQSITSGTSIQLAAADDSTANGGTYTWKSRDEMQEWRQKLDVFSEKTKAEGQKAGAAAANALNAVWTKTQTEARKLQIASTEGWESAKISFPKSSRELSDAWDKIRPQDK